MSIIVIFNENGFDRNFPRKDCEDYVLINYNFFLS